MDYREIGINDLTQIVDLWNDNIGALYPMDLYLLEQNYKNEQNRKKILGAYDGNDLAGFIIYKQWTYPSGLTSPDNSIGYINSAIVDMKYRKSGVGTHLFDEAEGEMKSWGIKTIKIGSDTFHFFPGIPNEFKIFERFLNGRGYEMGNTSVDLICDISKVEFERLPGVKLNNDHRFKVETLDAEDRNELLRFLRECFPGRWYGEIKLFRLAGVEDRDIVVEKDGDRIIGFSHIYDNRVKFIGPPVYWRRFLGENFGGLGPIGVDAAYRKQGLGLTLLYRSLEMLKNRGVHKMVIDWTELVDFYGIFNFIPWKQYRGSLKRI